MIVEVSLRISSDDGMPALVAERRQLFVQGVADFERTLFGSMGLLDGLIGSCREAMIEQANEYVQNPPSITEPERPPPWRPPER